MTLTGIDLITVIVGFICAAISCGLFIFTRRSTRPFSKETSWVCFMVMLVVAFSAIRVIMPNVVLFKIFNIAYEGARLWLMAAIINFQFAFIGRSFKGRGRAFVNIVTAIDGALLISNAFLGFMYTAAPGDGHFHTVLKPPYYIHEALLFIIYGYMIYITVRKILLKKYYIYWPKYLFSMLTVGISVVYSVFNLTFTHYHLVMTIWYFTGAVTVTIFTLVIRSKVLRAREYSEIFDSFAQYFFLFDNEGECTVANIAAEEFFNINEFNLKNVRDNLEIFKNLDKLRTQCSLYGKDCEVNDTLTYEKDGETYHLKMEYKCLIHGGKVVGEVVGFLDMTKEAEELEKQRQLARFDRFTNIYNYEWLIESAQREIDEHPEEDYFIIGSDIRDFKVFNDVFGMAAGDTAILKTAEILRELKEAGNIWLYGRVYSDRFGMLAKKSDFNESVFLNKFLELNHPLNEEYYHLNIHFGVYPTALDRTLPVKNMFDRAFVALDSIKNDVNIRIYHYNAMMRDEKIWEQTISGNIEKSLKDGHLRIVVQPQVDIEEKVIGGEALVRWRHPENGEISPGDFIPVLEKTGLVTNADIFVWEEACKLLRKWKDLGFDNYYISVNISPTDFMFADIYSIFTDLVEKYEINPANLKLEITETAMMTDVLERIVLIKRLEDYGFSVELDDFGSGYSSLNMLKEIPVEVIKMDMQFLYNSSEDSLSNSRKVINHIIQMAKDLDMKIVAEGVETKEQLEYLQNIGCDIYQGYYFSKPIEIHDFEAKQGIA